MEIGWYAALLKKMEVHLQEVNFQPISQITTWMPILMVAHTSTIKTTRQQQQLSITRFESHSMAN